MAGKSWRQSVRQRRDEWWCSAYFLPFSQSQTFTPIWSLHHRCTQRHVPQVIPDLSYWLLMSTLTTLKASVWNLHLVVPFFVHKVLCLVPHLISTWLYDSFNLVPYFHQHVTVCEFEPGVQPHQSMNCISLNLVCFAYCYPLNAIASSNHIVGTFLN